MQFPPTHFTDSVVLTCFIDKLCQEHTAKVLLSPEDGRAPVYELKSVEASMVDRIMSYSQGGPCCNL